LKRIENDTKKCFEKVQEKRREEMRCKNCGHKIIFFKGKWIHWNHVIHEETKQCKCENPQPKGKTLEDYKKEEK